MEAIGCNVEEALIVGEAGSTAEKYAQKYQRAFKSYDDWNFKHSYDPSTSFLPSYVNMRSAFTIL